MVKIKIDFLRGTISLDPPLVCDETMSVAIEGLFIDGEQWDAEQTFRGDGATIEHWFSGVMGYGRSFEVNADEELAEEVGRLTQENSRLRRELEKAKQ